jgi:putative ABC transport system permease protein
MFRNYLATALRNLLRNRLYAAINITGLAVGFAAALLIALFVRDEFSYDSWIPGHESAYRISSTLVPPGRKPIIADTAPSEIAAWLKLDFPSVIQVARLSHAREIALRHGRQEAYEKAQFADPAFFEVLPLPVAYGKLESALAAQDSVVITRRIARKYFGRDDVVGETIELGREVTMQVTAVLEDLPSNTHLTSEVIASGRAPFSPLVRLDAGPQPSGDFVVSAYVYFRLAPGASAADLRAALPEFLRRHKAPDVAKTSVLNMVPVTDIHFQPTELFALKPGGDPIASYALIAVGALIVAIAGINFVNLMTARATRRAVEVGVRKVSGADRVTLALQFMGEALLYVGLSMMVAVMAAGSVLPWFNSFMARTIAFQWDAVLSGGVLALIGIISVLAGVYPAFVLSAYSPATVLASGRAERSGGGRLRQGLVLLQFAMLVSLIVSTLVIRTQTAFAMNEALRIDKDEVLTVEGPCDAAIRDRVRGIAGVVSASCSSVDALGKDMWSGILQRSGGEPQIVQRVPVDFGFFELMGLKPLAGRFFNAAFGQDVLYPDSNTTGSSLIINETAARRLGFATPEAAVGQSVRQDMFRERAGSVSKIVGVVPDFVIGSTRQAINPAVYFISPSEFLVLNVKLEGGRIPETLAAIDAVGNERGRNGPGKRAFLDQYVQSLYLDVVRQSGLLEAFSGIALFTACLGLFGMAVFTAEQRTKEIGIRKAMGATKRDILRLLLWQFTKPILLANLIAWPAAYFTMRRWLEGFAYHIDLSPWMFAAASALALSIALLTAIGHALIVARAQPITTLRYE